LNGLAQTLLKMFNYYEAYGFLGTPQVLGWLLGCRPTTFGAFFERTLVERLSVPSMEG
jgi:hypothetical protein